MMDPTRTDAESSVGTGDPRAMSAAPAAGRDSAEDRVDVSVVIPIYNEEATLPELRSRLVQVLESLDASWEVIFVDDASTDASRDILGDFLAEVDGFRLVRFSRNFGHQAALYAGLCRSAGESVVLMDGDLQDPPEVIPELLEKRARGFEVVYAVRANRKESWLKRAAYRAYYRILQKVAYVPIPVDSGDFSIISRKVADLLAAMPERNKFLRGLRSWVGFRQTSHEYERAERFAGETKYTLGRLFRLAFDGLIAYSYIPLRLFYVFGTAVSAASFLLAGVYFFQKVFTDQYIPQGFTTLAILILFIGGIQLLALGLVGEYLGRIYDEVKQRPEYLEAEVLGFE